MDGGQGSHQVRILDPHTLVLFCYIDIQPDRQWLAQSTIPSMPFDIAREYKLFRIIISRVFRIPELHNWIFFQILLLF